MKNDLQKPKVKKPVQFKDYFNSAAVEVLAHQISRIEPGFNSKQFIFSIARDLDGLEFNARVNRIAIGLYEHLPEDRDQALKILRLSLPENDVSTDSVTDGWLQWPIGQFIANYGLSHFESSWACMLKLTKCFSAEFAIRPFVEFFPEKVISRLFLMASSDNVHIRRLCSEAVRPYLPWGKKIEHIVKSPKQVLPIILKLSKDPEKYVQKSVGNLINDISKDHPFLAVEVAERLLEHEHPASSWIARRGLRTLVKKGFGPALKLLGYASDSNISVDLKLDKKQLKIGEEITVNLLIENLSGDEQQVLVDYLVYFVLKNGKSAPKVFKWTEKKLSPLSSINLTKKHSLKQRNTKALYPGKHRLAVQINGKEFSDLSKDFYLNE